MNESPVLPELWDSLLEDDALHQLISDLQNHADILNVQEKQSAFDYSQSGTTAFDRLRTGLTHAMQIYYRYDGKAWCDTIMKQAQGYKLIRMQMTNGQQSQIDDSKS